MNKLMRLILPFLAVITFFVGCETTAEKNMTPDEKLIYRGTSAWNEKGPVEARAYWKDISDGPTRTKYLGYIDKQAALLQDLDALSAMDPDETEKIAAAYEKTLKAYSSVPPTLKLQPDVKNRILGFAAISIRQRIKENKVITAQELTKSTVTVFGDSNEITALSTELTVLVATKKKENEADTSLKDARDEADFVTKIKKYELAIQAYAKAETTLADQAKDVQVSDKPSITSTASKLKKKRQDTKIEMDRRLREREYSFKDRIGEEFARVPEGDKLGNMSLEDVLKFQEEIRKNIEADSQELNAFAAQFPQVIDRNMLREVEEQKKEINDRITQVENEIRTAKEVASRGKPILPLMIGLFNPQPGGTAKDQKSRPGVFRGPTHSTPDYWWGITSIPKGTLNDLVISINDNRTVRVFADNTKSGSRIGQDGLVDLVNRNYKVGNVWPVLNAGNQLKTGNYYIEIQNGKNPTYAGEAVIYSSFVMRTR